MKQKLLFTVFFLCSIISSFAQQKRILVFSKTAGFRHTSIKEGKQFLLDFGKKDGILVDTTENAALFNEENLKKYNAVVWLNTTGDVLNSTQQAAFERYIQAGGGYVGIHAASDTEYGWLWYNDLMGGYFDGHPGNPNVQLGKMTTLDKTHPSTLHLPETFERKDEFYNFKSMKKENLKFLVSVDEKSYTEGKMGDFHPMSWYHEYDGGKAFYTNFGHTPETFSSEPLMAQHIGEGIKWAMAQKLDYAKAHSSYPPEENRFIRTTLTSNLDEPTELAAMPNGKIIFTERKGNVKVWNPANNVTKVVAKMPAYTKFEYGVMGVGVDPNFEKNNWVYIFYTPESDTHKDQFLSRFVYDQQKDTLVMESEKVVLRYPVKRDECCHTGGSIDWDSKGNLYLSSGDDTNPFASDGFAPIDAQLDRRGWDAQSTSANTNDLRGKILRIKTQDDGSYTIPEGNLFPVGTPKARPEIFVMGCRNPYRIAVDKTTDYLYWGDVGPDAGKPDPNRGPEGYVEFNQARKAGNYGWPMFAGNNFAYNKYDFVAKKSGEKFNPEHPINDSPNNTGLQELPPTNRPMIWYSYAPSAEFPELGKGGCNPMAGPVYNSSEYTNSANKFPTYFDGKFFAYEWMRDWIMVVSLDKNGNYAGIEPFMPNTKFYHPMDMTFNKDGVMYVLDYGLNWFSQNEEATLSKIEYNAGNRKPVVMASADKKAGAAPLAVQFSSKGTIDYDNDAMTYSWNFGKGLPKSTQANPKFTFTKPGLYEVALTVKDSKGNSNTETIQLKVGNATPEVKIAINSNKTFFFNDKDIDYEVKVNDKEDGTLTKGIDPSDVMVNINYLEGYDKTMLEQGHKTNVSFATGKRLIDLNDCKACHSMDKKSIGPAYKDVASKYRKSSANIATLAAKVISGGGGVWGEQSMSAHPQVTQAEARDMVDYILSLNDTKKVSKPVKGSYETTAHKGKKEGAYLIQATYTDKGGKVIGPLTSSETIALRSTKIKAVEFDKQQEIGKFKVEQLGGDVAIANGDGSYFAFNDIDITGIKSLSISAFSMSGRTAGGTIELHQGSENGMLLGSAIVENGKMLPVKIALPNTVSGMQNLYFVFKNKNAEGKPLFAVSTIEFLTK